MKLAPRRRLPVDWTGLNKLNFKIKHGYAWNFFGYSLGLH